MSDPATTASSAPNTPGDIYIPEFGGETHQAFVRACASLDREELCYEGQSRGFLAVPVNSAQDIVGDPHLHERGTFIPVDHPQFDREIDLPRLPIYSTGYQPVGRPAPTLGADSADVLAELLGVDAEHYDGLVASGLVAGPHRSTPTRESSFLPRSAGGDAAGRGGQHGGTDRDDLPLKGIRVIDFCWQAAGPLTTELMANLGADVIKIETDARIDTLRVALPAYDPPTIETGAFFQDCNTDKRSINLNLGAPDGLRVAYDLIRDADVVTDNFTGGVMKRLGLGFDDLKKINPRIVVCSLPVMGTLGTEGVVEGDRQQRRRRSAASPGTPAPPTASRPACCCTPTSPSDRSPPRPSSPRSFSATAPASAKRSRSPSTRPASTCSTLN